MKSHPISRREAVGVLAALLGLNAVGLGIIALLASQASDELWRQSRIIPILGQAILIVALVVGVIVVIRQWRLGWRES